MDEKEMDAIEQMPTPMTVQEAQLYASAWVMVNEYDQAARWRRVAATIGRMDDKIKRLRQQLEAKNG